VHHPRTVVGRFDPRFHQEDTGRGEVARERTHGRSVLSNGRKMSHDSEQAAHDVERPAETERAHVPEDERNSGKPPARNAEHRGTPVDPHDLVASPQDLQVPTGPAPDVEPRPGADPTILADDLLESARLGGVVLLVQEEVVVGSKFPEHQRPLSLHERLLASRGPKIGGEPLPWGSVSPLASARRPVAASR
jgi:hypothetical protein